MSETIERTRSRIVQSTLIFFSFIGFVASTIAIVDYFRGESASELTIGVTSDDFLIPQYVASYLREGDSTRRLAEIDKNIACEGINSNDIIRLDESELNSFRVEGKTQGQIRLCRDSHAIAFVLRWADTFSRGRGAMITYNIKNTGNQSAQDIKLNSELINAVQVERGRNFTEIDEFNNEDYYKLPDLNPGESMKVFVWVSGEINDVFTGYDFLYEKAIPTITHSGSVVSINHYKSVSETYADAVEIVADLPIVLAIPVLLIVCFVVTGVSIAAVSLIVGLYQGKSLQQIFGTEEKSDEGEERLGGSGDSLLDPQIAATPP